jgi:hypothetical protein
MCNPVTTIGIIKDMKDQSEPKDATETYQPSDFIALALAQIASERLDDDRIHKFAHDIHQLRERSDNRYLEAWEKLIEAGPEAIRRILTERSDRGQVLRSVCTFRAFVSPQERADIIAAHVPERTTERSR